MYFNYLLDLLGEGPGKFTVVRQSVIYYSFFWIDTITLFEQESISSLQIGRQSRIIGRFLETSLLPIGLLCTGIHFRYCGVGDVDSVTLHFLPLLLFIILCVLNYLITTPFLFFIGVIHYHYPFFWMDTITLFERESTSSLQIGRQSRLIGRILEMSLLPISLLCKGIHFRYCCVGDVNSVTLRSFPSPYY